MLLKPDNASKNQAAKNSIKSTVIIQTSANNLHSWDSHFAINNGRMSWTRPQHDGPWWTKPSRQKWPKSTCTTIIKMNQNERLSESKPKYINKWITVLCIPFLTNVSPESIDHPFLPSLLPCSHRRDSTWWIRWVGWVLCSWRPRQPGCSCGRYGPFVALTRT